MFVQFNEVYNMETLGANLMAAVSDRLDFHELYALQKALILTLLCDETRGIFTSLKRHVVGWCSAPPLRLSAVPVAVHTQSLRLPVLSDDVWHCVCAPPECRALSCINTYAN